METALPNPDLPAPDLPDSTPAPNPLLADWSTPFGVPPFAAIRPEHFPPAFEAALEAHRAEIETLAADPAPPSFATTLLGLETQRPAAQPRRAGVLQSEQRRHQSGAAGDRARHRAEARRPPRRHLHRRPAVSAHRRAGGRQGPARRRKPSACWSAPASPSSAPARSSTLPARRAWPRSSSGWRRSAPSSARTCWPTRPPGRWCWKPTTTAPACPISCIDAALRAGAERGHPGKAVITLSRSSIEPFLTFSTRRDLREQAFEAWIAPRRNGRRHRQPRASSPRWWRCRRSGRACSATRPSPPTSSTTPWPRRRRRCARCSRTCGRPPRPARCASATTCRRLAEQEGVNVTIAGWDWRHYAEKLRKARFDLDEAAIKPYLPLDQVIAAAFDTAGPPVRPHLHRADRRAGLSPRRARLRGDDGTAATSRCSSATISRGPRSARGAWMTSFRTQEKLDGDIRPIIVNVMNFAKGGRAGAAVVRRRPHAVPRVRPRAARHAVGRHLSLPRRHRRRHRFRRAALAALRALAVAAGGAARVRPPPRHRRSRCRRS